MAIRILLQIKQLLQYTLDLAWPRGCLSGGKRGDYQNCSVFVLSTEVVHSNRHT